MAMPWVANSVRISHLGINPVRGGNPPRDSKTKHTRVAVAGAFVHTEAKLRVIVVLRISSVRKALVVMTM